MVEHDERAADCCFHMESFLSDNRSISSGSCSTEDLICIRPETSQWSGGGAE